MNVVRLLVFLFSVISMIFLLDKYLLLSATRVIDI